MEGERAEDASPDAEQENSFFQEIIIEAVSSPLNLVLLAVCCVLIYKIYRASRTPQPGVEPSKPSIPKLKKQDMTLQQLRQYDGRGEHNRVCVAVNGKIFDMTRGYRFYGPGGVYSAFAGRDATHALASFNMADISNESSDLSDLTPAQMDSLREWEMQFAEKYIYIGRLIKDDETPAEYSDEEDAKDAKETSSSAATTRQRTTAAEPAENPSENTPDDKKSD